MRRTMATTPMTADEFLAADDPRRWIQLIEGEVVVNQPTGRHQYLLFELIFAISTWIRAGDGRGAVSLSIDVRLDDRNVYAPDILWYAGRSDAPDLLRDPPPYPVPDLAVEVRSPSTWRYDVGVKKRVYEREGLQELWLVDGEADSVLVYRRSRPDAPEFDEAHELTRTEVLTSPLLPGFAGDLGALFGR